MVRLRVYSLTAMYLLIAWIGNTLVTTTDQRVWFNGVVYVGAFVGIEALVRTVSRAAYEAEIDRALTALYQERDRREAARRTPASAPAPFDRT